MGMKLFAGLILLTWGQIGTSSPGNYILNMTTFTSSPTNPLFFSSSSPTNYPVSTQAPSIFISSSSPTNYPVSTQAPSNFAFSPSKKSKSSKKSSKEPKSFSKSSKAPKSPESKKSSKSVKSLSPVSSPVADECIVCSNNPTGYMTKKA